MIERIYLEISNICNLKCAFCPPLERERRTMSIDDVATVLKKIKGRVKYVYLHLMGEPLLHSHLGEILSLFKENGVPVCITTNGTLLKSRAEMLIKNADIIHKVSLSLHALEGNGVVDKAYFDEYMDTAVSFAKRIAPLGTYTVFRLWNEDTLDRAGQNSLNFKIKDRLSVDFAEPWQARRGGVGYRLDKNIFLEYAGIFTWPIESEATPTECGRCHGLSQQIGILADGTVVPCCLDSEGQIALGNIFESSLEAILATERARAILCGFNEGKFTEPLCQKCTYARRFK